MRRTRLRWSKRKLVLDRGSQYLSSDASSSPPSLELAILAASLMIDYPHMLTFSARDLQATQRTHLVLVSRHVRGGELGDVVLSQSGEDAGLERVVVRDDVPHIWRDRWCGVQLRQRSRTSGTL